MRKRFGQSLRIGITPQALALVATRRWGGAAPQVLAERGVDGAGPDAIGAALRQLLADAGVKSWPARLVLADELARLWQVTPPEGSARLADLEGAAALRFQALFGEPATGWQIAAGWQAGQPFLAAALPRTLLARLTEAAAGEHLALVEIVPQFVAGWNRWHGALRDSAWFGQVHDGVLTLGAMDGQRLQAVRAVRLPDGATLEWLAQHAAREALRLNLAAPARLQLAGPAPAAWQNAGGALACSLLDPGQGSGLAAAARLAITGHSA